MPNGDDLSPDTATSDRQRRQLYVVIAVFSAMFAIEAIKFLVL